MLGISLVHKEVRDMVETIAQFVSLSRPRFQRYERSKVGSVLDTKIGKKGDRVRTRYRHTYTIFFTSNSIPQTLYTLPTQKQQICFETSLCLCVHNSQTKASLKA